MTAPLPRAELERFGRLLSEYRRRQARDEQAKRGWYDDNGIRQGGLIAFVRHFWHVLEPETPFVDGWVLWAMAEHLEAVTFGEIHRLLINVPPGFAKSLMTDVFWPAWEWGPMDRAHLRYVTFAYAASLTERDNGRFRDLVTSAEYQTLWKNRVEIVKKGDTKVSNEQKGWKFASSVSGVGTGERGDRVILDDPHNVKEAESETVRTETVRWFRESMSSRLNDLEHGAIVIIMQRVHEDDVSGAILSLGLDYVHLCVPMLYEYDRQVNDDGSVKANGFGWVDARFIEDAPEECDGAFAWPERFPQTVVTRIRAEIGPYAWAGQYQQTPTPRGGGIFQRLWWQLWNPGNGKYPLFDYIIASLDSAFTENEQNDPSGLTIWGVFTHPESKQRGIMLIDAWRKWLQLHGSPTPRSQEETLLIGDTPEVKLHKLLAWKRRVSHEWGLVEWTAFTCGYRHVDKLLVEAKTSGLHAAQELQRLHSREGWAVQLCAVKGDKVARALSVQPIFSQGMVYAPARDWSEMVIDEMAVFPRGKHDDLTDSATQALKYLRVSGLAQTQDEAAVETVANVTHQSRIPALYPV